MLEQDRQTPVPKAEGKAALGAPIWQYERERRAKADAYFENYLRGQREWYTKKASANKRNARMLSVTVLLCGVLTTLVQIFESNLAIRIITATLGALTVLSKGVERVYMFEDTWTGYRKASEAMKQEYRLYVNDSGDYAEVEDEEKAYRLFVEQIEAIIAEESKLFWKKRTEGKYGRKADPAAAVETEKV